MKQISFRYLNALTDPTPNVLVTSENQHVVRGFNTNYMTKGQATRLQNVWRQVENQPWSADTKVRVVMNRVGSPARNSFRSYRTDEIESI